MKALFVIGCLLVLAAIFGTCAYGLYLAFSASIVLGFLVILIEPAPLVIGLIGFFGHPELCKLIVKGLHLV